MRVSILNEKGKDVELVEEAICFRLDASMSSIHLLVALSAIQTYIKDGGSKVAATNAVYHTNKRLRIDLTLACTKEEYIDFLRDAFRIEDYPVMQSLTFVSDLNGNNISDYDFYVDLSLEKAIDIVKVGNLHLHQGFGIMIGSNTGSLAQLETPIQSIEHGTLLLADCTYILFKSSSALNRLLDNFPTTNEIDSSLSLSEILEMIRTCEAVIGVRCFATYIASCLKKPVLEFYEGSEFWLLSQWSNPYYVPFDITNKEVTPAILERSIDRLLENVKLYRDHSVQTKRDANASIVDE